MKIPAGLKVTGYVIACLAWLLAGLTLLGPLIGAQFFADADSGPKRELPALTCPARLKAGETASIGVRLDNRSGKTQNYDTHIEVQLGDATRLPMSASCQPPEAIPDGESGSTTCSVGPIAQVTRVRVTVWAEGENYHGSCDLGCANSFRSACVIMPDVWTMLLEPSALLINGVILGIGLALVAAGARLWAFVGTGTRIVMAGFFTASALMLALAVTQTFGDWIAAALVIGPLPEAVLVAGLWVRQKVMSDE